MTRGRRNSYGTLQLRKIASSSNLLGKTLSQCPWKSDVRNTDRWLLYIAYAPDCPFLVRKLALKIKWILNTQSAAKYSVLEN
jgi:hypothetical protein